MNTSKTGQYDVLSVGRLASIMTCQVAGYRKCVVPGFFDKLVHVCSC